MTDTKDWRSLIHVATVNTGDWQGEPQFSEYVMIPLDPYQMGNLISAGAAQWQAILAARFPLPGGGADYAKVLAMVALATFAAVGILAAAGPEAKEREFS